MGVGFTNSVKLGFIDGEILKPTVPEGTIQQKAREMVNSISTSWIMNIIDPKLHTSVTYVYSTHVM